MSTQAATKSVIVTEAELVQRARDMVPKLIERAEWAELDAKVPDETIREMTDAGFFRVLQPRSHGGFEMSPRTFYAVQMTLAEGCMSTAWVYGVLGVHPWQLALFDPKAQSDVWGKDADTLVASTYMPVAKVTPEAGGFRISGRWSFSSGCEHASWIFLGGMVPPQAEGGAPEYRTFLLPRKDYEIVRNWNTFGLKGTGSHDIVVADVFVPEYRTHRTRDDSPAARPGAGLNSGPLYRLPFAQVFTRAVSTSCIGGLQGALNAFRRTAASQVSRNFLGATANDPTAQLVAAEAASAVDQLKTTLFRNFEAMMDAAEAGEQATVDDRLLYRFQSSQAPEICAHHVSRLLKSCGGSGIYSGHPVLRYFLDIHAGRAHVANYADPVGRNYGGFLCGLENKDMTV
ncbi:acyl-CoA dehydrogenase family protein [Paraburkholderia sacchari]|uniref:Flavin-dependent monooxygenase n=1 Tax=Paraburkholderia sacchari TaxID=159450 RepID=A0A8T6ZI45_9BURK|nr:acyl-CoA dehydrogenase family protein [Paraburkholderia sacchari]NLP64877.1 flavin-dependent monooxygenase [Paraburkholderia sacchari]